MCFPWSPSAGVFGAIHKVSSGVSGRSLFAIPMLRLTSLPEDVLRIIFELVGPPDLCSMRATCRCLCEGMPADHPLLVLRQKEWQSGLVTNPAMGDLRSRAASIEEYAEALVRNAWKRVDSVSLGPFDMITRVSGSCAVYLKQRGEEGRGSGGTETSRRELPHSTREVWPIHPDPRGSHVESTRPQLTAG